MIVINCKQGAAKATQTHLIFDGFSTIQTSIEQKLNIVIDLYFAPFFRNQNFSPAEGKKISALGMKFSSPWRKQLCTQASTSFINTKTSFAFTCCK